MSEDRQDHQHRVERFLGTTSDSITSPTATGEGEMEAGAPFTATAPASGGRTNNATPIAGKPRCIELTKAGTPCKGWALGDVYGDASDLCIGHARARGLYVPRNVPRETLDQGGDSAKWLSEMVGAASRTRTPLAVLREKVEADPDKYVALWEKAAERGSDIRALSAIFKLIYEDDAGHVAEPHSFDEMARLTREERRQLLTQLEQEGRGSPFRADAWRAAMARDERERRAVLSTLSQEERWILAKDLAALEGSHTGLS
jgi:hypothetical protein